MDKLENYITDHTSAEQEVLRELNRETHVKVLFPRMMSGHLQGKFLQMVSWMIRPGRVLEIGTYTGYSAICLAGGLKEQGVVHTIEINPELEDIILKYVVKAGLSDKIKLHIGDAIEIIPTLSQTFDLVFIDADKREYTEYFQLIFNKVSSGGYIIADNTLWSGKILETPAPEDHFTKGIIDFNTFIKNNNRIEKVILPLRDGMKIIRKK